MNESEVDTAFPELYFTNPEGIVGALMSAQPPYQLSSLISMLSAVLWHLKTNVADCMGPEEPLNEFHLYKYIEHRNYLQALLDKQVHERNGGLSCKEKKNYMSWPAIEKVFREKIAGIDVRSLKPSFDAIQDWVIASLYVLQCPTRADYARMRVFLTCEDVPGDFKDNYFTLDPPAFTFWKYKNAGRGGVATTAHVNPVEGELLDILTDWLEVNDSDWLLVTRKGGELEPMTENALSLRVRSIFKRWTGRAASIGSLRHSFVSYLRDTNASATEKKAAAERMMHHPLTSETYVRKPKIEEYSTSSVEHVRSN